MDHHIFFLIYFGTFSDKLFETNPTQPIVCSGTSVMETLKCLSDTESERLRERNVSGFEDYKKILPTHHILMTHFSCFYFRKYNDLFQLQCIVWCLIITLFCSEIL